MITGAAGLLCPGIDDRIIFIYVIIINGIIRTADIIPFIANRKAGAAASSGNEGKISFLLPDARINRGRGFIFLTGSGQCKKNKRPKMFFHDAWFAYENTVF